MKTSEARITFYRRNLGIPVLLGLLVFVAFDLTGLDRTLSAFFYDAAAGSFPVRHSELFERVTHKWPRVIPDWTGGLAIIGALLSFIWPLLMKYDRSGDARHVLGSLRLTSVLRFTARQRVDFLFVIVAFAVCTGMVHFLKNHTSVYCPVETTLYGGPHVHREWFETFSLWGQAGPGRCWPGGHASSAFSLFAVYFVARRHCWRYSPALLGGVIVLGLIYGTTRVMQGWHFMSHTLWSGIIVWLCTLLVALCFYGRPALQRKGQSVHPIPLTLQSPSQIL